jgi:sulfate transport system ATP-binding protein
LSPSSSNRFSNGATRATSPRPPVIDATPTTITIEHIVKGFNGAAVIKDVSLDVRAGELLALLGPSGSGKTTLLRIIAGLETPDSGRIVFSGADTTRVPVQERAVGFVFQHYALFKHMTVADNIAYGLRARKRRDRPAAAAIAGRVAELLDLIKLDHFADRYPSQLSGGQRQRVALARALAVEPRVLLLDEPFGALDAQVRKDLRRWLRDIHVRTGQTTIFVTHDQDEALELSDRVAVLHAGRLEQVGTPIEVQDAPASVAVLKFLGDALEVAAVAHQSRLLVNDRFVPVAVKARGDRPTRLFVRPWQFELATPEDSHVQGIVKGVYRAQGRAHVTIERSSGVQFTVDTAQTATPRLEERIGLKIIGGYLFD